MMTREELAREAGCLDLIVTRPGPDGRVAIGPVARMPALAFSTGTTEVNLTGGWKSVRPLYQEKRSPCQDGCPAGEDVSRYLRAVQRGQYDEGWRLIMEDNPFPSVMGRVCYHPCEAACNRESYDEPVVIHAVERFLGDYGLARQLRVDVAAAPQRERVAIIGAGPAGLSAAYHLVRRGYGVTVFEVHQEAGGVLRWGIPSYRLPRDILRQEVSRLQSLGVEIRLGVAVGRDLPWEAVHAYQAVVVATGLPRSRHVLDLGRGVEGLYSGLEFLRRIATGPVPHIGRRVAVIGGGNVAIDVARSAFRLGAEAVSVVCVETFDALPAHPEEIEEAALEGVDFACGFAVRQPIVTNGRITGLEIAPVRFLGRNPDGGVRFESAEGASRTLSADSVIQAIGQKADLDFLPKDLTEDGRLATDGWGRLQPIRPELPVACLPPHRQVTIYAVGDVVSGPARVVDAIAAGKRAATAIHQSFRGDSPVEPGVSHLTVQFGDLNPSYFNPARRAAIPQLVPALRRNSMAEVNGGWAAAEAAAEARRCFNCGLCTACDNCLVFCPDVAVRKNEAPDSYRVLDQYCKGCGICARECPRHVITMIPANLEGLAQLKM